MVKLFRPKRIRPMIEQLEPRILYSADLNPALASNPALMPQFEQRVIDAGGEFTYFAEASAELARNEVVFVDTATPDYQALVDGIRNDAANALNTDVVVLDANSDGISQISEYLANHQDVSAIHIISHGSDAAIQLGQNVLDVESLKQNADQISLWGNSLTTDADLMIYGCDVAQSDAGRALIDSLARLTGADVAASTDLTGSATRGGDWNLEYQAGRIEANIVIGAAAQQNWNGTLNTDTLAPTQDSYVNDGSKTTNYGGNTSMVVDRAGGGLGAQRALLKFDISSIPASATITSATLTLNATANGGALDLDIYEVTEAWVEGQVTWNQRTTGNNWSSAGVTNSATTTPTLNTGATGLHNWDVTTLVTDWYNLTKVNHGLMIASPDTGTTTVTYDSSEGTTAPQLVVNYTLPQAAPVLSGTNNLTAVNEDPVSNTGTLVSALISGHATDINTENGSGIAVTAVDNTNGTWQYTTNGTKWNDFGTPGTTTARLLDANASTYVRFVPNADWNGTLSSGITFRAWDQTTGTAGATADVTSNGGATAYSSATASADITVNSVNDRPTVSLANITTTFPEDTDTTSRVKVADIVITDDGTGTNVLSLTGSDAALFEIIGTELFIKAGTGLDFETKPLLDVTVEVNDAALPATPADSGAAWWDANWSNRRQITFDNTASATNLSDLPVLVKFTAADIDFGRIKAGGADIRFVDSGGATLDYEIDSWDDAGETAAVWVRVPQVDLGSTTDYIHLYYNNTAASDAQTPAALWPTGTGVYHLDEDPGPGGAGDIKDSDGTSNNGTADASMTAGDLVTGQIGKAIDFDGSDDYIDFASTNVGNSFTISAWIKPDSSGTQIQAIAANSSNGSNTNGFRFFLNSSGTTDGKIRFETGNGGSSNSAETATGVINLDEWNHVAVTVDRTAGTARIYHNGVDVTNDGTIRTDFNTFSDWEIGRMEGSAEFTGVIDEFRVANSIRTADWIEASYLSQNGTSVYNRFGGEGLAITITDVNDAPTVDLDTGTGGIDYAFTFTEGDGATTIVDATVAVADEDDTTFVNVTLDTGGVVNGAAEELSIGNLTFALNAADFNNAAVTIGGNLYTVDWVNATGVATVTLNSGEMTIAQSQTVMLGTAYQHTDTNNPTGGNRTIDVRVNDGGTDSAVATTTITVAPVNDAATVDLDTGTAVIDYAVTFTEGYAATTIVDATVLVTDVDDTTLVNVILDTGGIVDGASEQLTIGDLTFALNAADFNNAAVTIGGNLYTVDWVNATGVVTVTLNSGEMTIAQSQALMLATAYQHTDGNIPTGGARTIAITVNDGNVDSAVATSTITVTPVNDAATVDLDTGTGGIDYAFTFTEGDAATTIVDATVTVADVDDTTLVNVTLDTGGVVDGASEQLTIGDLIFALNAADFNNAAVTIGGNLYTVDWVNATGIATITLNSGEMTFAQSQAVMLATAYQHTDTNNPTGGARTIDVRVNDGDIDSAVATTTITVAPVNDAATVDLDTGTGGIDYAFTFNEGDAASTIVDATVLVADVDDTTLVNVTLDTGGVVDGASEQLTIGDLTFALNAADFNNAAVTIGGNLYTVDWVNATGIATVTLNSGEMSIAQSQAVMLATAYQHTDTNNPTGGARTIAVTVNDGNVDSAVATSTITVAPVNDAPTINATAADAGTEDIDQVYTHAQMLTLIGASDVDDVNANLSVAITNVVNGSVALTGGTGGVGTTFTFTPTSNFVGGMTFDYQVRDDNMPVPASSAVGTATVTLSNVNDPLVGVPTITGTVTEDQILTADTSGISDADGLGAFSYQWLRGGVAIGGATASTYTLGNADVGNQISVRVSYTDGQGTAENATSGQTAPVTNVNDTPVGIPAITGTVTENQILTADTSGISDADGLGAFSYQWLRGGVAIGGATASTYTLGNADVGNQVSVRVNYMDGQGTAEGPLTSAQTAAVTNVNDTPVGVPTITGTATEDQILTADTSGISDADGLGAFSYQWLRGGAAIGGATLSTYTLGDADVGNQISVRVSYTDGQGTFEGPLASAQTAMVTNINDNPIGVPTITGTVQEDQILTADTSGISDADGLGALSYQWLRGGVAIGGATASTHTLGDADVGAQISVQVSYLDGQGTSEGPLTSAQSAAVINVNDVPVGVPTITGTATEDQILTAIATGISDVDGLGAFSYQWLRGGVAISGATASTYALGDADVGTQISMLANYTDGQGTAESVSSATTGPVVNINDAPTGSANTVTTVQNTAYVFSAGDFGFSDSNDNPANNLLAVRIAALPAAGTLTDNGVPVVAGQIVNAADINAGWLAFTPANATTGVAYATFTFQVQDDGAGSDMDLIARALTVNVSAPAGGIPLPLVISPPPVVDPPPPPVASGANPETVEEAPTDEESTEDQTETAMLAAAGSSTGPAPQSGLVSEVRALNKLSGTQTTLRPVLQQSSHSSSDSDSVIKTDIWLDFLSSLNSSPTTTQVSAEEISVILDRTDFGETSDEQFFSVEAGLQLSGVALSAGFVSWAIRGAGLFASLLTSLPAWRHMDPLPILKKKDEKEKERDWNGREDGDGHEFDEEVVVRNLWTPGGGTEAAWSGTGATVLDSSGEDTSRAEAESIMNFLEHVASRDDTSETEKPA